MILIDIGQAPIKVHRDRDGSFEPQIERKYQRRTWTDSGTVLETVGEHANLGKSTVPSCRLRPGREELYTEPAALTAA